MHFCTYFDRNYLHRGLALYESLARHAGEFTLWILAFDDETLGALERLRLPHVRVLSYREFEAADPELRAAKDTRSLVEYYWSSTPSLPLQILAREPSIDILIYVDADIFFYTSPRTILDELGSGNILIVPHDHAKEFADRIVNGIYNVGVMAFRKNAVSLECLRRWRAQCIEWCYYRLDSGQGGGGVGDQGYLNDWPQLYPGVVASANPGINAAPWNVAKYRVRRAGTDLEVAGRRLVSYHFHACRICTRRIVHVASAMTAIPTAELALVYRPYLDALVSADEMLRAHGIPIAIPRSGFPWRYVLGQIKRGTLVKHFMTLRTRVA